MRLLETSDSDVLEHAPDDAARALIDDAVSFGGEPGSRFLLRSFRGEPFVLEILVDVSAHLPLGARALVDALDAHAEAEHSDDVLDRFAFSDQLVLFLESFPSVSFMSKRSNGGRSLPNKVGDRMRASRSCGVVWACWYENQRTYYAKNTHQRGFWSSRVN